MKEERYDSPERLAKYDAESFAMMVEKREEVAALEAAHLEAKKKAADAKKKWELARNEYEELIGERKKYRGVKPPGVQLTFDNLKVEAPPIVVNASPHVDGKPVFTADAPHQELWKTYPLDNWKLLGLTAKDVESLAEGKIKGRPGQSFPMTTVGDVTSYTEKGGRLTDIYGIGEAAATRFADANDRFWNLWNTKGLDKQYAKENGYNLDANAQTDAAAGAGTAGDAGGGGDGEGQPAGTGRRRKPHAANPGGKSAKRKPTAKAKGQAAEDAGPADAGDDHLGADAPTIPFPAAGGDGPGQDAGPADGRTAAAGG